MSEPNDSLQRALTQSGVAIALGLTVQMATLPWTRPSAFLAFVGLGGSLVILGVVRYLWALVRTG